MASNFIQPQFADNPSLDANPNSTNTATTNTTDPTCTNPILTQHKSKSYVEVRGNVKRNNAPNHGHYLGVSSRTILNDAYLIRNLRISSNQKMRKNLELISEDKVSRHKLEEVHSSLPSSVKSTFIMTFSPDGQRVASTHGDHRIYICDLNTGKLLDTLEGHKKTPWCLAWHPSNREIIASGCLSGEVRVWDLRSKACESWTSENNTIITSLDFHPRECILVIATANDIHFWDWTESEPFAKTTTNHDKEKVKFVVFDSSGTKLITGISNLPKFAGCSGDSLQNRIIDSYLTHGTIDQLSTDNMTQNSEITTSPLSGGLNSNGTFNATLDRQHSQQPQELNSSTNNNNNNISIYNGSNNNNNNNVSTSNNEQDVTFRNTLTLSRVAFLYRQLEALEDSMRHTSFLPYINSRSINSEILGRNTESIQESDQQSSTNVSNETDTTQNINSNNHNDPTLTQNAPSQSSVLTSTVSGSSSDYQSRHPRSNTFEPFLVSFDECLEQLQLPQLVINGRTINQSNIIEQYPIDSPYQLHYVMQFESISQVNQNFIRISKLMSSARLYRQIIQQIISYESGNRHCQPNQILTAQSVSPTTSRNGPIRRPIVHDFQDTSSIDLNLGSRLYDPISALQYRNSARNVPLVTICKIDLLIARSVCIMRSQQLVEQASSPARQTDGSSTTAADQDANMSSTSEQNHPSSSGNRESTTDTQSQIFYPLLNQLHQSLTSVNHAPLAASNVYAHLSTLRGILNKLLDVLSSLLQSAEEGRRIVNLIHNIAGSLTGRSWEVPFGATFNDIRADVVYTLCIVDLSLHLARQIQLLQMQRLSAMTRVEESRRSSQNREIVTLVEPGSTNQVTTNTLDGVNEPGTSVNSSQPDRETRKRKKSDNARDNKRARTDNSVRASDTESIDSRQINSDVNLSNPVTLGSANIIESAPTENLPADRLVVWNAGQNQSIEQSLQRFLVATASGMSNSHILVRIYHRLNAGSSVAANNLLDQSAERINPPFESRRRALSQDNSSGVVINQQDANLPSSGVELGRGARQIHVSYGPNGPNHHLVASGTGGPAEGWQRHPHLHVYQSRGAGQHLWFNQWTIPLPVGNSNYRIQCWNFSPSAIPNIKDPRLNVVTQKCRIHNDSSIDVSKDGKLIACLVPREDGAACLPNFDLRIFSLKSYDLGACYYRLPHGPNAISVSLSPSANYAVVGLASHKFISNDPNDDDLTIAKVFKLNCPDSYGYVRDIKIKRDDSALSLNAIRWMSRGIVYNVGPQHHQRYQATRMRNIVAS